MTERKCGGGPVCSWVTAISPSSKSAAINILGIFAVNLLSLNERDNTRPEGSSDVEFKINMSGLSLLTLEGIASRSVTISTSYPQLWIVFLKLSAARSDLCAINTDGTNLLHVLHFRPVTFDDYSEFL